jgi:hypothetical protein
MFEVYYSIVYEYRPFTTVDVSKIITFCDKSNTDEKTSVHTIRRTKIYEERLAS